MTPSELRIEVIKVNLTGKLQSWIQLLAGQTLPRKESFGEFSKLVKAAIVSAKL